MKKIINLGRGIFSIPNDKELKSEIIDFISGVRVGAINIVMQSHPDSIKISITPANIGDQLANHLELKLIEINKRDKIEFSQNINRSFFKNWFKW